MIVLVMGPESTGTRAVARALGSHPGVTGPGGGHEDPLDDFWAGGPLPAGDYVTRRSVPAGAAGKAARAFTFPDEGVRRLDEAAADVRLVVTSRAFGPTVASAAEKRASVRGNPGRAASQTSWAYRQIAARTPDYWGYVACPVEALWMDPEKLVRTTWRALGLPAVPTPDLSWVRNPNRGR